MNVIYRDPAPTYPVDSAAPPLADEKMRALIVPVPTATGSTYRSSAYLSKALVHTGPDVLDMFIFRPSAALAATRYLMLFDAESAAPPRAHALRPRKSTRRWLRFAWQGDRPRLPASYGRVLWWVA